MAELVVFAADAFSGKCGEDVEDFDEQSFVVRMNNVLLANGKAADIALDWVLVVQLQKGTFGPHPTLTQITFVCALLGTLVELYAVVVLFRLKCVQQPVRPVERLKRTLLNRKLAWWRFGSDDLPTFAIGLFLLLGSPPATPGDDEAEEAFSTTGNTLSAYAVIIVSVVYSVYALIIHLMRPPQLEDKELLKQCHDADIEVTVLRGRRRGTPWQRSRRRATVGRRLTKLGIPRRTSSGPTSLPLNGTAPSSPATRSLEALGYR